MALLPVHAVGAIGDDDDEAVPLTEEGYVVVELTCLRNQSVTDIVSFLGALPGAGTSPSSIR